MSIESVLKEIALAGKWDEAIKLYNDIKAESELRRSERIGNRVKYSKKDIEDLLEVILEE